MKEIGKGKVPDIVALVFSVLRVKVAVDSAGL